MALPIKTLAQRIPKKRAPTRTDILGTGHICFVNPAGNLVLIDVPEFVEKRIIDGKPIPSSFLFEVKIIKYIIAPAYLRGLERVYSKEKAEKIEQKLIMFLELARIHDNAIQEVENKYDDYNLILED